MVGPGEVDEDLEPEVKEECNTKYGEVNSVVIYEIPNVVPEESVRIFIEFKRVESAIKGEFSAHFFSFMMVVSLLLLNTCEVWPPIQIIRDTLLAFNCKMNLKESIF